jgi:hypothetical protein
LPILSKRCLLLYWIQKMAKRFLRGEMFIEIAQPDISLAPSGAACVPISLWGYKGMGL